MPWDGHSGNVVPVAHVLVTQWFQSMHALVSLAKIHQHSAHTEEPVKQSNNTSLRETQELTKSKLQQIKNMAGE
jgi:hypothetical protein